MKNVFLALAASTMFVAPSVAAEIAVESDVASAIVFPRGADVTRVVQRRIPAGDHEIIVTDLPEGVNPETVRIKGLASAAVRIGAVDVRSELIMRNRLPERRAHLENALADLRQELVRFDLEQDDIDAQRAMIHALSETALRGGAGAKISAKDIGVFLGLTRAQMAELTDRQDALATARRGVQGEIDALARQINELQPVQERRTVVAIAVSADVEAEARFDIRYAVEQAGWRAIYDADLTLGESLDDAQLSVTQRAEVRQATGEVWDDIELTLSTSRPRLASAPPVVQPWIVDVARPRLHSTSKSKEVRQSERFVGNLAESDVAAAPIAVEPVMPVMETGGFDARYVIAGQVDVAPSNETTTVTIGAHRFATELSVETAPAFDPTAYLMAAFSVDDAASWLPGPVFLTRDGNHVGRTNLPLLAPGQEHRLGFGVDDRVRIEHSEVDRKTGESGILTTSKMEERRYLKKVHNTHGFTIPVRLIGQLPVSNNEEISVTMLETTTPVSERNVDDKRGVLAWDMALDAGDTATIDFGYQIRWPDDLSVSGVR